MKYILQDQRKSKYTRADWNEVVIDPETDTDPGPERTVALFLRADSDSLRASVIDGLPVYVRIQDLYALMDWIQQWAPRVEVTPL